MIKQIADNVHGTIVIEEKIIEQLINTREFTRLHQIKQLGLTNMLYPMATHTRYAHSLGVYELARRLLTRLEVTDEHKKLVVLVASLLHDIGHGPLSHLFEGISSVDHEDYTVKLIKTEGTEVNKILSKNKKLMNDVVKVIQKKHPVKWMNTILSSQLDIDRLDYLLRDSLSTGNNHGVVNVNWLFRTVKIVKSELVYDPKAIAAIEQFIVGRYHMYRSVYQHPKNVVWQELYTMYFKRVYELINSGDYTLDIPALKALATNREMTTDEFLSIDDNVFMTLIKAGETSNDPILRKISKLFAKGQLPKYEVLKTKTAQTAFVKGLKKEDEGRTWKVLTIAADINRYGSHSNEEAIIADGAKRVKISKYSGLIERSLADTKDHTETVIGVKI